MGQELEEGGRGEFRRIMASKVNTSHRFSSCPLSRPNTPPSPKDTYASHTSPSPSNSPTCPSHTPAQPILRNLRIEPGEVDVQWLRDKTAVVSQAPTIFDTSVGENIRYGSLPLSSPSPSTLTNVITDTDIRTAARQANVHEVVMALGKRVRHRARHERGWAERRPSVVVAEADGGDGDA
jgi:hypothetical protein